MQTKHYINIEIKDLSNPKTIHTDNCWIKYSFKFSDDIKISKSLYIHFQIYAILYCSSIKYLLNVRNWLIYYNYHHSYYTSQSQWTLIIDPTLNQKQNKQNWFIKNKCKYGNLSYIMKLFGIILIFSLISSSIGIKDEHTDNHRPSFYNIHLILCYNCL